MGFDLFAAPVLLATGAISSVFGSDSLKGTTKLMGIQMQMLANLSSKLDVLHDQIGVLLEQNAAIAAQLQTLPGDTVEMLYRNDLEGLFLLVREKLGARDSEVATQSNGSDTSYNIFSELLRELQISRSKLFARSNFLQVPLVAMCLYHELLLMHMAGEPESFVRQALRSYVAWLTYWRDGGSLTDPSLGKRHNIAAYKMLAAQQRLPLGDGYIWNTSSPKEIGYFIQNDPTNPYIITGFKYSTEFRQKRVTKKPLLGTQ
jgi:hypothetical protein